MSFQFNQLKDMKEFAKHLSSELHKLGCEEKSKMANKFSYNPYLTSFEYLNSFKIFLEDLKKQNIFQKEELRYEAEAAICAINKALGN